MNQNEKFDEVVRLVRTSPDHLLTPGEVALLFRVDPKTVTRWAAAGKLRSIKTYGGHRRFRAGDIRPVFEGGAQ